MPEENAQINMDIHKLSDKMMVCWANSHQYDLGELKNIRLEKPSQVELIHLDYTENDRT